MKTNQGVISIQVVQKFYQVATRKIAAPISAQEALQFIHYMSILQVVVTNLDTVVAAIYLHKRYKLSFWDALIVQAARSVQCSQLLSEDLQDDFRAGDLVVKNPF